MQLLPKYRNKKRTFISTTECLDPVYQPVISVSSRFRTYFEPIYLTDEAARLNPELDELFRHKRAQKGQIQKAQIL